MPTVGPVSHTRRQSGFTLIELLLVVVIIGILAALAIPKFAATKEKAYDRTVMSDIKRAHLAAEAFFADYQSYPTSQTDAEFTPSSGVTFTRWQLETKNGIPSLHLHAEHANSTHYYHSHYPADPILEQRNK